LKLHTFDFWMRGLLEICLFYFLNELYNFPVIFWELAVIDRSGVQLKVNVAALALMLNILLQIIYIPQIFAQHQ